MRPLSAGKWLFVESWKKRLFVTVLELFEASRLLRWGAAGHILSVREEIPGRAWQTRGWSNCAVLSALLLGRSSWSWTPHGLYRQLLREDGVEHVFLEDVLVEQIAELVGPSADLLRLGGEARGDPIQRVLLDLGRRWLADVLSPTQSQAWQFTVYEGYRFPRATCIYATALDKQIEYIADILAEANNRCEVFIADCRRSATLLVGMLRGSMPAEALFERYL